MVPLANTLSACHRMNGFKRNASTDQLRDGMPNQGNPAIARKSRARAEADFATWLMMAKLGSFEDLPANAQTFLTHYQDRLKTAGEKEAASATIEEVYAAYYVEMGGKGMPPGPGVQQSSTDANVVQLKEARQARAARPTNATSSPPGKKAMPALLVFFGLVLLIMAAEYLMGNLNW